MIYAYSLRIRAQYAPRNCNIWLTERQHYEKWVPVIAPKDLESTIEHHKQELQDNAMNVTIDVYEMTHESTREFLGHNAYVPV